jgi:hypothetical protein
MAPAVIPTLAPPQPSRAAFKGLEFSKNVEILIKLPCRQIAAALVTRSSRRPAYGVRHADFVRVERRSTPKYLVEAHFKKLNWIVCI